MHEYYIGRSFYVASINADTSGLNDDDIKALERFEFNLINEYGHALFNGVDDHEIM